MKSGAAIAEAFGTASGRKDRRHSRQPGMARGPHALLHRVAIAAGDGIGPEIMEATLRVLEAARAPLQVRAVRMGQNCAQEGVSSGIPDDTWGAIRATGVLLKGPMSTPQGDSTKSMKSMNVTLRKSLGLFANVRPLRALAPWVQTDYPGMDLVVIRENEDDLYASIEHRQTDDVAQYLKPMARQRCERIIRYAFEYARTRSRRRLTCMAKNNTTKLADGLFYRVFDEIAQEYPEIESEHMIVDIGWARAAANPQRFDVIVTPNLEGDILSDIVAEVSGAVGMAPSADIGHHAAVFEATHGSAPDIAGRDIANPSGLLLSSAKMLAHLGVGEVAELIHNAWLRTIEDGMHTTDVYRSGVSRARLGTQALATAVIERLGEMPRQLVPAAYPRERLRILDPVTPISADKEPIGSDVFVQARCEAAQLAERLTAVVPGGFRLQMITHRGAEVWPAGQPETFCTDHWRCRFVLAEPHDDAFTMKVVSLLDALSGAGIDWIKTEHLYNFEGGAG